MELVWVEKYRPSTIDNVIVDETTKKIFSRFLEKKELPYHLLFVGAPGCGKTTTAKVIARSITRNVLYINSSDHTSVDVIRNEVKSFCTTMSFNKDDLKIIILDEADGLSNSAQQMLRNTLEEFVDNCKFILTANYDRKIIDPIQSRCQKFTFKVQDEKKFKLDVMKRCIHILKEEKIEAPYLNKDLAKLIQSTYPDIRKTINTLQKMSHDGTFAYQSCLLEDNTKEKLFRLIRESDIKTIRKDIIGSTAYEELYKILFDNASELSTDKSLNIMLLVGTYLYQHSSSIDLEINFISCVIAIIMELKR